MDKNAEIQQRGKLLFESLRACENTFPRGEGAPQGRMRNGDSFVTICTQIVRNRSKHVLIFGLRGKKTDFADPHQSCFA